MSSFGIATPLLSLFQTNLSSTTQSRQTATGLAGASSSGSSGDFSSSLTLRMATLKAQSVNMLLGSVGNGTKASSSLDFLTGTSGISASATDPLSLLELSTSPQGPSASGRNPSLFDPESAYRMMSAINNNDVTYKAQFSELNAMKAAVAGMQQAGQTVSRQYQRVNGQPDDQDPTPGFCREVQRLDQAL